MIVGKSRNAFGFTLIELLVVIAVIAALMAILMSALQTAREQEKRACCLSNLKQLQLAWTMYADDFDGKIVNGSADWDTGGENPWAWRPPRAPSIWVGRRSKLGRAVAIMKSIATMRTCVGSSGGVWGRLGY